MHFQNVTLETKDPTTTCSRQEKKKSSWKTKEHPFTLTALWVYVETWKGEKERERVLRQETSSFKDSRPGEVFTNNHTAGVSVGLRSATPAFQCHAETDWEVRLCVTYMWNDLRRSSATCASPTVGVYYYYYDYYYYYSSAATQPAARRSNSAICCPV